MYRRKCCIRETRPVTLHVCLNEVCPVFLHAFLMSTSKDVILFDYVNRVYETKTFSSLCHHSTVFKRISNCKGEFCIGAHRLVAITRKECYKFIDFFFWIFCNQLNHGTYGFFFSFKAISQELLRLHT